MKKTRISESQIVSAIKQHESGESTVDICRELGNHQATFYNWKKKYSGMDTQELCRLKELEEENRVCSNFVPSYFSHSNTSLLAKNRKRGDLFGMKQI